MRVFISCEPDRLLRTVVELERLLANGRINNPVTDEQRATMNASLGIGRPRFIP